MSGMKVNGGNCEGYRIRRWNGKENDSSHIRDRAHRNVVEWLESLNVYAFGVLYVDCLICSIMLLC